MEGAHESTELWRHPLQPHLFVFTAACKGTRGCQLLCKICFIFLQLFTTLFPIQIYSRLLDVLAAKCIKQTVNKLQSNKQRVYLAADALDRQEIKSY